MSFIPISQIWKENSDFCVNKGRRPRRSEVKSLLLFSTVILYVEDIILKMIKCIHVHFHSLVGLVLILFS